MSGSLERRRTSKLKPKSNESSPKLLANKTAIITGGAYGIGRAIAEVFLNEGARVILFDKDEVRLKQTVQALAPSGNIFSYRVDVRNKTEIEKAVTEVENRIGPIDILVNNAGVNPSAPFLEMPDEMWEETIGVNLTGARNMTQIVGTRMVEKGINGSIVFISSVHTQQAFPNDVHYDSSKHGMVGLMRGTAAALGQYGIRSNAVAPGAIYPTGITENITPEALKQCGSRIPLGRTGEPKEIAQAVLFLASERASYVTGAELRVDGGLSIKSPLI